MLHLTLRQLTVFEAVARYLSFTRAAEELHLSQPAVSIQVRQLEEAAGLPLFEQIGKKIYLTDAGRELQGACQDIFARIKALEMSLADFKGMVKGRLDVAVVSGAQYFMPHILGAFLREYAEVEVRVDFVNREQILKRLGANAADLVVMGQVPDELDVEARPFLDNPLVIVAPTDHALARLKKIPLARLATETFVQREPGSGTRKAMEQLFAKHGLAPRIALELGSSEAIKQAVMAGLGLALVSRHNVALELASGKLAVLDMEGLPLKRQWFAVYPKGKKLSIVAKTFLDFVLASGDLVVRNAAGGETPARARSRKQP
jgi:DNA-binding transcriptional LysR family regulator